MTDTESSVGPDAAESPVAQPDETPRPSENLTPAQPWWRRRRTIAAAILVLLVGYGGLVAMRLMSARSDLESARDLLNEWRAETDADTLLDSGDDPRLAEAEALLDNAANGITGPLFLPVRIVPLAGTQIDSVQSLTTSARDLVRAGRVALAGMVDEVDAYDASGDRLALVEAAGGHIADLKDVVDDVDLGPGSGLIGPLPGVREEFSADYAELVEAVDDASAAVSSLHAFLQADGPYLVLGANNAEMRAGSGMVLSLGEMTIDDGEIDLGDIQPVSELAEFDPVEIDRELEALYGNLGPGREIRNINVLPAFPRVAQLAAAQWRAITGHEVDGVVLLDSAGLATMVGATGPIEVDGISYDQQGLLDYLLTGQYLEFHEVDQTLDDVEDRRDRLGDIADTVFNALQADVDAPALVRSLQTAARQRHLLIWSADPEIQAGWEAIDVAGVVTPESLLLSILNRGGDKMDAFLNIEADLSFADNAAGGVDATLRVSLENATPEGMPHYVTGRSPEYHDVREEIAEYVGILSVSLPGAATSIDVAGADILTQGPDSPSQVVGALFTLLRTENTELVVTFHLPDDVEEIRIEPTARGRSVPWTVGGVQYLDGWAHTIPVD